jgi:hypothetical protein
MLALKELEHPLRRPSDSPYLKDRGYPGSEHEFEVSADRL